MKKLNNAELNEIRGGQTICLWSSERVDFIYDGRAVGGRVRGAHLDKYLGFLAPRVIPFKYGK